MRAFTGAAAVLAIFGGVGAAWSGAAAAQTTDAYQVVRAGDGQMSCEDLATQVNSLTAEASSVRTAAQQAAANKLQRAQSSAANGAIMKRAAWGGLAQGMAFMPFGGGLASLAVRSAAINAAAAASNGPEVVQITTSAASPVSEPPQAQRLTHLTAIFQRKAC